MSMQIGSSFNLGNIAKEATSFLGDILGGGSAKGESAGGIATQPISSNKISSVSSANKTISNDETRIALFRMHGKGTNACSLA